jgi:hypothetical protein
MLVLLYVQIVQTNNNKSSWKEKKKFTKQTARKYVNLPKEKKQKILIKKT